MIPRGARAILATAALTLTPGAVWPSSDGAPVPPEGVHKQIEQLTPQRPGAIDVYALVIGGDGSENVFMRESRLVQKQLEAFLGTAGRVVTLVNNRAMARPEATINSIDFALQRIAARMDKNHDLLFLHLTSHGSRDHYLTLKHPTADLNWLGRRELARLLERSGIRHRFIVISACYSGGFISELANEDTVVVTAAARTVMSRGCGDQSEITEFSRMFYTRALPSSRSLLEVAQRATQYVHESERQEGVKHSYPQTSIGANMVGYLRQLEADLRR